MFRCRKCKSRESSGFRALFRCQSAGAHTPTFGTAAFAQGNGRGVRSLFLRCRFAILNLASESLSANIKRDYKVF